LPVVCGIELTGSKAHIVTLKGVRTQFEEILLEFKKISVQDHKNQEEIISFRDTIQQYLTGAGVERIGLSARPTTGEHAGGVVSFKLEALIQSCNVPVVLVYPATYNATLRKHPLEIEKLAKHKYLIPAYKIAYHMLGE